MIETILVSVAAFCVSGTAIALVLCGAARGTKAPVPTPVNRAAEDHAASASAR